MKYLALLALLAVTACSATTNPVATAKDASYGLHAAYGTAVGAATAWASQPRCTAPGAPPVPFCSTAAGVLNAEAARLVAVDALGKLDAAIVAGADATAALSTAQAAVTGFSNVAGK